MTTVLTRDSNNDGENNFTKRLSVRSICRRAKAFIYRQRIGLSRGSERK